MTILYGGIDLHSNNVMISLIDDLDQLISEKRLPNDLTLIQAHLEPFKLDVCALAVESTYNWYWLVDGLQDQGFDVRLANTVAIKQYEGIKHTNDATDARYLAQLLRMGIPLVKRQAYLCPVFSFPVSEPSFATQHPASECF